MRLTLALSAALARPLLAVLAAFAALAGPGCARRRPLDEGALARILAADPTLAALRVHVDRRLIVVYPELEVGAELTLGAGVVEERSTSRPLRQVIGRRRAGAVIAAGEDGLALWVSFDPACVDLGCALAFVAHGGAFVLASAPARGDHRPPEVSRIREAPRARLAPLLVDPAIDGATILAIPRRRRQITVALEIRARSVDRTRAETTRAPGFGRPPRPALPPSERADR